MDRLYKMYKINDSYELYLTIISKYLKISIENNLNKSPRHYYAKFFTYNKLINNFTFLNQFNNLKDIFFGLDEIFTNKKYNIEFNLYFIKINLLNRTFLIIPEIDINHNRMIDELFKKNEEMKNKIYQLKLLNNNKKKQLLNLKINFENINNTLNFLKNYPYRINNIGNKIRNLKNEEQNLINEKNRLERKYN